MKIQLKAKIPVKLETFGDRLRQARNKLGLRQIDIVKLSGIPIHVIQQCESGKRDLSDAEINKLKKYLEYPLTSMC